MSTQLVLVSGASTGGATPFTYIAAIKASDNTQYSFTVGEIVTYNNIPLTVSGSVNGPGTAVLTGEWLPFPFLGSTLTVEFLTNPINSVDKVRKPAVAKVKKPAVVKETKPTVAKVKKPAGIPKPTKG